MLVAIRAFVIFGLFAAFADAQMDDGETTLTPTGGLSAWVKKNGANIRFYRTLSSGKKTGQITVKFPEIREVDTDGKVVLSRKYNLNAQDFTVSAQSDVTLPYAAGVMAKVVTLNTTLSDVMAQLKLQVYVIQNDGNLTLGDETSTVFAGQLKFTVEVNGWKFNTSEAFIEFEINVQIPPGQLAKEESDTTTDKKHPKRFSFGGGAKANFSKKVQVDGAWQDMASGYPTFKGTGANNIITLRLPKFINSTLYDPTFDAGTEAGTEAGSGGSKGSFTTQSSLTLGIFCCLVFMLRGAL